MDLQWQLRSCFSFAVLLPKITIVALDLNGHPPHENNLFFVSSDIKFPNVKKNCLARVND